MKAIARVIRSSVRARAVSVNGVTAAAYALPGIQMTAEATEQSCLRKFLTVVPVEPQQLLWINPQYGIDYDITTSPGLHWKII